MKKSVFFCIVLIFLALIATKVLFFNEFGTDDGDQADIALNILQGKLALNFQGNYLDCNKYFFVHPPLYHSFLAINYKIFGATYLTSKFVSVFFALLLAGFVATYCYRYLGILIGLIIASLVLFDPLLFSFTYINRGDIAAAFFFTLAALLFIEAEKRNSLKLTVFSGLFSGVALVSSYNCNWLLIAFSGYALYSVFSSGIRKNYKKITAYLASVLIITLPWYGWILLGNVRRQLFFSQLIGLTSSVDGYSLPQIIRKLLNPLADFYLTLFRQHSAYAIITLLVLVYFLFNLRKHIYPFLLLAASIVMMFFNQRAPHYFIIIMPVCYILFGYALKDFLEENKLKLWQKKFIYISLVFIICTGLVSVLFLVFKKSDIKLDSQYFSQVIEKNTLDSSRIATDPVFVLANHGNRQIVQAGLLIWKWFRKPYKNYDEVVSKAVNADYVVLTQRQKNGANCPLTKVLSFRSI